MLGIAAEMEGGAIEAVLGKSDLEIALGVLSGEIKPPNSINIALTKYMRSVYDKHQAVEEPREGTTFKHGFEDQKGG